MGLQNETAQAACLLMMRVRGLHTYCAFCVVPCRPLTAKRDPFRSDKSRLAL